MNDISDILGMKLHDATALLEAEGLVYDIIETKPPRKELTEGILRVIKTLPPASKLNQGIAKQKVVLTVCRI